MATTDDFYSRLHWPAWSRDSRRLAFAIEWAPIPPNLGRVSGVYSAGIDGTDVRLLVPGASMPAYSPDGRRLAYILDGDVFVADADGTNGRRLAATSAVESAPAWSPDGRTIALQRVSGSRTVILVATGDGGRARVVVSSPRYSASLPSWQALPGGRPACG